MTLERWALFLMGVSVSLSILEHALDVVTDSVKTR